MEGAGPGLYSTLPNAWPGIEVDAVPSRQFIHAAPVLRQRFSTGPLPEIVVVHLGTNGLFDDGGFDDLVDTCSAIKRLVFLTIKAPRDWEGAVNRRLAKGVQRHPVRATLLDWHAIAGANTDYLCNDKFHLSRAGAVAYAEVIVAALRQ